MSYQKILFVEYCADDFLGGTVNMEPLTELAYRRVCDMIYSTEDNLLDNDSLQYSTKTGTKWKKIRQQLIDMEKIFIEDGYIRNKKCKEKIAKSRKNIEQKRDAGYASSEARKSLKDIETGSTAVPTPATTDVPTNQRPKDPSVLLGKEPKRARATIPKPDDVSHETFEDFVRQRKKKFTATALKGIRREAEKAGWTLEDALSHATMRGWEGFNADWVKEGKHENSRKQTTSDVRRAVLARHGITEDHPDHPLGGTVLCDSGHLREIEGATGSFDGCDDRGPSAVQPGEDSEGIQDLAAGEFEDPDACGYSESYLAPSRESS